MADCSTADPHHESVADDWMSYLMVIVNLLCRCEIHLEGCARLQMARMTDLCCLEMPYRGMYSLDFSDQGRLWLVLCRVATT